MEADKPRSQMTLRGSGGKPFLCHCVQARDNRAKDKELDWAGWVSVSVGEVVSIAAANYLGRRCQADKEEVHHSCSEE